MRTIRCVSPQFAILSLLISLMKFQFQHNSALASDLKGPAPDFKRHRIVQPTVHHARTKREISTTRHVAGLHHEEVIIKVGIDDEEYTLDLKINKELVPEGHVISYQQDGKKVLQKPKKMELDICQYSGSVRDKPGSWAAVSTCHGVRGVIYDGKRLRYIEPTEANQINKDHYLYDQSDLNRSYACGTDDSGEVRDEGRSVNSYDYDRLLLDEPLEHHDTYTMAAQHKAGKEIHPVNSNLSSQYVELVLVADHGTYVRHKGNIEAVHRDMKDIANIVNSLYSPFNIFIALVGVVIWNSGDEITLIERSSGSILDEFLKYRADRLNPVLKNDNAVLISTKEFDGNVVGKAYVRAMCSERHSGAIALFNNPVIGLLATTIAHEIGHNFGLDHDKAGCYCPDRYCIMIGVVGGDAPVTWSQCSRDELNEKSNDEKTRHCLRNKPTSLFDTPTCGNGFLEPGEECDCSVQVDKRESSPCHYCCDPEKCKLRRHATCASGECCDLNNCRPKSAGVICRAAPKECDLPEHCTGYSEFCPADVFKMDSTPCGKHNEAYCVSGSCKSKTEQCRQLWGPAAQNSDDECYLSRPCDSRDGRPCSSDDRLCGKLQCQKVDERRKDLNEMSLNTKTITFNGKKIVCARGYDLRRSKEFDRSLVPDGAKCGHNKMCLKQRCVPVNLTPTETQPGPLPNLPLNPSSNQPGTHLPKFPGDSPHERPTTKYPPSYHPGRRPELPSPNDPVERLTKRPNQPPKSPIPRQPTPQKPDDQSTEYPLFYPDNWPYGPPPSRNPVDFSPIRPSFIQPPKQPSPIYPGIHDHPTAEWPTVRPFHLPYDHTTKHPNVNASHPSLDNYYGHNCTG